MSDADLMSWLYSSLDEIIDAAELPKEESDVMEKMKTFVCGDARIEAISKASGMQISLDGAPLDLACLCATTIRRIADAMGKPHFDVLLKVLMFLQADEVMSNITETSIDVHRIQEAMRGDSKAPPDQSDGA